jgi:pilus assembly protein Flp/PilA
VRPPKIASIERRGHKLGLIQKSSMTYLRSSPSQDGGTAFDMRSALKRIKLDRGGATAIEYAMIAFFISIAAFTALQTVGSDVTGLFTRIANSF